MAVVEIHKDDIGTTFQITIKNENDEIKNISGYSTKQIIFKKPSGNLLTKTASFLTDGSDGVIYYTTVSGDIDEVGVWKIQAVINNGSTNYRKSNVGNFRVFENLS